MKPKDFAKHIALGTCVYYTAATFLILFIYFALNIDLSGGMQAGALVAILPFAFCFALANCIYRHTALVTSLRFVLHYVLTVGGAFLFLFVPNRDPQQKTSSALLLFLIFTVIYLIVMVTILVIAGRIKRVQRDEGNYHSVYKK